MRIGKRVCALLFALLACLGAAGCTHHSQDAAGQDWRTTGLVQASGTITRDGEDISVLVCVHADSASIYYDMSPQTLFASVEYPVSLPGDPGEAFRTIDFADRNGDGCGDVAMLFGSDTLMVWYWDGASGAYVYQPEESQIPDSART